MKRFLISVVAVACGLALALPACAQDLASQIVGVWKFRSYDLVEVETAKSTKLFGENPVGTYIYTKARNFVVVIGNRDRKSPATGVMTDEDRVHLHKTMATNVGTYKLDGNKVHNTYEFASNGVWTGTTRMNEVSIAGNVMTLKTPVSKAAATGILSQSVIVLERVE
jgi:Lipocalin-like domain